jgi:hypothetical protein
MFLVRCSYGRKKKRKEKNIENSFSGTFARLATASPQTLTYLAAFFADLVVPPTLHCARCHKGYFDVENNDRN